MVHALLVLAAEEAEPSKTPFYLVGGVLVAWAIALTALGMTQPKFPGSDQAARGVMAISFLLVLATAASAVLTA